MSRTQKHPYTKSKAVDTTCRNHGSCPYCQNNREYKKQKQEEKADSSLIDWKEDAEKTNND